MPVPLKVVLDTNLFVSILLGSSRLTPLATLIRSDKVRLIFSPAQIGELTEVLHRPKFRFPPKEIRELLDWIRLETTLVVPEELPRPVSRDPKDDFLLSTAVRGGADFVVTRDKDLLVRGSYEGIPILLPEEFISKVT